MSDKLVVICGPMENAVMPGSKIVKCSQCGAEASVSPVGQKVISDEGGLPYCPDCGIKLFKEQKAKGKTPEIHPATQTAFKAALEYTETLITKRN